MNLIKVEKRKIAGCVIQTVSARELYKWLEVGRDFSTWIKGRINEYGFIEGEDYIIREGLISPDSGSSKARLRRVR